MFLILFVGVAGNKTELLTQKKRAETSSVPAINAKAAAATAKDNKTDGVQAPESDGLLEVEKASQLRFTEDDRVHEVIYYAAHFELVGR